MGDPGGSEPARRARGAAGAVAVIRRAYAAFAARDIETLRELSDEAIEIATVTGLMAGRTEPYRGHAGLEQYMNDLSSTWKRLELQPQNFQSLDGERTLVFGRVRAWDDSGVLDASNAWVWTVRAGRVVSVKVLAGPGEAPAMTAGP